ncbi:MAG: tannase/feruloyl esterase family alpha/beta hydrolase [Micromonosporaceae bacterium]
MHTSRAVTLVTPMLTTVLVGGLLAAGPSQATGRNNTGPCAGADDVAVPGAEQQLVSCLTDLTTAGTAVSGHTIPADWAGLHAPGTTNPTGIAGIQVEGYFPDTSTTNTWRGWNHDAQFVIRLPDEWNGKLVVTGAPGVRRQFSSDYVISDWVLAKGYAYASTDKGNNGAAFYQDGESPGDAVAEWHERVEELTVAAKRVARQVYGTWPKRTYMTGISNGGYLTRWQLENNARLFDGGVDWEGTLFTAEGPNLFTYLPTALREYPSYAAGDPGAAQRMYHAGFEPGSEFLWDLHNQIYWDLTQRIYREEFDPTYDGALEAGIPFCASGTPACDADYDYASRPDEVHEAVERVSLTGKIKRPLLTLHGTLDTLLPIGTDSDVYTQMISHSPGRARLHRYYRIEDGNHVDGFYPLFPDQLRPMLPCYRTAFEALEAWVEDRDKPPASTTVARPASGDLLNTCTLN